jgi:hypothetical protein
VFDMLTYRQLARQYSEACQAENDRYLAKALYRDCHPETGALDTSEYGVLTAAADEACEMRRAMHAELTRREREHADA